MCQQNNYWIWVFQNYQDCITHQSKIPYCTADLFYLSKMMFAGSPLTTSPRWRRWFITIVTWCLELHTAWLSNFLTRSPRESPPLTHTTRFYTRAGCEGFSQGLHGVSSAGATRLTISDGGDHIPALLLWGLVGHTCWPASSWAGGCRRLLH